jgi:2,3-bisphosphoglycerate-independent phosphoglycerate mutase
MTLIDGPSTLPVPSVCLIVLDGWGMAAEGPGNAVAQARTPNFDRLWESYPHTTLSACGRAVGLPSGQMGNSEVGHLNLGAGSIVRQDLTRIDDAISEGSFSENAVLADLCQQASEKGRLHLLGLVSDGGVHASMAHLHALLQMARQKQVPDVVLHAFTDGRDTSPHAGRGYLGQVQQWLSSGTGRVGSVSGRYYAMDRDGRWERTQLAYEAIACGHSDVAAARTADEAVSAAYERGETDEFIRPTLVGDGAQVRPGDPVIFFNFRPDRARQLTQALAEPGFDRFERCTQAVSKLVTLTQYQEDWDYPVAFSAERPKITLAACLASHGVSQLHVAETEKYAHVTYFFNGGEENAYQGERHLLVASPREVPTYDFKPEMSAGQAAESFIGAWAEDGYRFGIINFANPDMVGHTGVIDACVAAVEAVDARLGDVVNAVHASGGACVVTADHGNADNMLEPDGGPNTAHSLNPVPLIATAPVSGLRDGGVLADVAPTVLELLGIEKPREMTNSSLIEASS